MSEPALTLTHTGPRCLSLQSDAGKEEDKCEDWCGKCGGPLQPSPCFLLPMCIIHKLTWPVSPGAQPHSCGARGKPSLLFPLTINAHASLYPHSNTTLSSCSLCLGGSTFCVHTGHTHTSAPAVFLPLDVGLVSGILKDSYFCTGT